ASRRSISPTSRSAGRRRRASPPLRRRPRRRRRARRPASPTAFDSRASSPTPGVGKQAAEPAWLGRRHGRPYAGWRRGQGVAMISPPRQALLGLCFALGWLGLVSRSAGGVRPALAADSGYRVVVPISLRGANLVASTFQPVAVTVPPVETAVTT